MWCSDVGDALSKNRKFNDIVIALPHDNLQMTKEQKNVFNFFCKDDDSTGKKR